MLLMLSLITLGSVVTMTMTNYIDNILNDPHNAKFRKLIHPAHLNTNQLVIKSRGQLTFDRFLEADVYF